MVEELSSETPRETPTVQRFPPSPGALQSFLALPRNARYNLSSSHERRGKHAERDTVHSPHSCPLRRFPGVPLHRMPGRSTPARNLPWSFSLCIASTGNARGTATHQWHVALRINQRAHRLSPEHKDHRIPSQTGDIRYPLIATSEENGVTPQYQHPDCKRPQDTRGYRGKPLFRTWKQEAMGSNPLNATTPSQP